MSEMTRTHFYVNTFPRNLWNLNFSKRTLVDFRLECRKKKLNFTLHHMDIGGRSSCVYFLGMLGFFFVALMSIVFPNVEFPHANSKLWIRIA